MIVTSNGLLFAAGNDGKMRAFDVTNGAVLWSGELPGGSRGIPAMYEAAGRQYLAVPATVPLAVDTPIGRILRRLQLKTGMGAAMGYVAFALPEQSR
jgi:quinoprotein glucose dehydrogenase